MNILVLNFLAFIGFLSITSYAFYEFGYRRGWKKAMRIGIEAGIRYSRKELPWKKK